MTEVKTIKKNIHNIPETMGDEFVLVDRNLLSNVIAEIEDKLDELEAITNPEFMKEVSSRVSDIESGKVEGLDENKIFELLRT